MNIAPLLTIRNEREYNTAVKQLNQLLCWGLLTPTRN